MHTAPRLVLHRWLGPGFFNDLLTHVSHRVMTRAPDLGAGVDDQWVATGKIPRAPGVKPPEHAWAFRPARPV